ncbi:uncharacterized protein PHALS_00588 [Plasmopara halstedii]|uniref:Uncharacterized protein n=1 Tax=Plasmopara halstedii TaxID=4781 RepID=A0A0N7L8P4_PLAHL|nr:uncharacterized protein PHALS_00588 [Plasmopara halstedii]CEG50443.1 hypothetical protein PHALS_00588 [Plasmopara halstedii]|eukprot:XP_024586812.1 hypothetical protein PHALS_00588 [Plasmopara halstedii]
MALLGGNKRYESPVEDPEPDVAKNGSFKSLYEDRQYALTFLHRGYTEKPCVVEFVLTKSQRIISQPSLGS